MIRRLLLVIIVGAGAFLVPWTWYLAGSLPDKHGTDQWRLAWVGFDAALVGCFVAAAWLGWRRRRAEDGCPVLRLPAQRRRRHGGGDVSTAVIGCAGCAAPWQARPAS
jgi:hypothetical protein